MDLNEEQKRKIEPNIKNVRCPMCRGQFMYHTTTAQLLFLPTEGFVNIKGNDIDGEVNGVDYLVGECQTCGYTMLKRLAILLKDTSVLDEICKTTKAQ